MDRGAGDGATRVADRVWRASLPNRADAPVCPYTIAGVWSDVGVARVTGPVGRVAIPPGPGQPPVAAPGSCQARPSKKLSRLVVTL